MQESMFERSNFMKKGLYFASPPILANLC